MDSKDEEDSPTCKESAGGVISATCTFNNQRRSAERMRGPMIKRNFNFLREIKVVPYNINKIEKILTK